MTVAFILHHNSFTKVLLCSDNRRDAIAHDAGMKNSSSTTRRSTLILTALLTLPFAMRAGDIPAGEDFVAHEWGTFTSVQGADGVQFDWNPFVVPELPKFILGAADIFGIPPQVAGGKQGIVRPGLSIGKAMLTSRQRMETPVIYFYSKKERTVDVDVRFVGGRITEWYPQLTDTKAQNPFVPVKVAKSDASGTPPSANSLMMNVGRLHWTDLQLRPGADETKLYPTDETGSHYYAARETDSVPLRVKAADGTEQNEKFLFYRGVANFDAPLYVRQQGDNADILYLGNRAKQPLKSLFVYAVRGDRAALVPLVDLKNDENRTVAFNFAAIARPLAEVRRELASKMCAALVTDGLYEKEATAMVKTWDDSWFAESGTRVLYTLPEEWTNGVLPLTVTPAPKELRRVFVGRAEMITPAMEWAVLREVVHYAEGDDVAKAAAIKSVQALGMGRFTAPAIMHATQFGPQAITYRSAVSAIIQAIRPPAPKTLASQP